MAVEDDRASGPEIEAREPTLEDLRDLCRQLNAQRVTVASADRRGHSSPLGSSHLPAFAFTSSTPFRVSVR
jgi:hypothetical protein